MTKNISYTARVINTGGREGRSTTHEGGELSVENSTNQRKGTTNPEELFALGYAACFHQALEAHKAEANIEADSKVQVKVHLLTDDDNGFEIAAEITGGIDGESLETVEQLMNQAHETCPYSNATRGNIDVTVSAVEYSSLD